MADKITSNKASKLNENQVVSDLFGTLFELGFCLVVIVGTVFSANSSSLILFISLGYLIIFSVTIVLTGNFSSDLMFREISLALSFIILEITLSFQSWPVFLTFAIFVFGNSILGIWESRIKKNKYFFRKLDMHFPLFTLVSFIVILFFLSSNSQFLLSRNNQGGTFSLLELLLVAFVISIISAIINNTGNKILRNFLFPIIIALVTFISFNRSNSSIANNFEIAFTAAAVISFFSFKLKYLTYQGALYQFVLAFLILGFGGWKWTVPILVFFITSSLLSKIKSENKNQAETFFEKSDTRDSFQVLANGGLGGLLVLFNAIFPSELFYMIYVSSLAVVCSDTWGTEIGTLFKNKTFNIIDLKETEQGISGGVSIPGSAGALLGAFIIPLSSLFWLNSIMLVSISGFLGNIVDSLLGAVFQVQYLCKGCGKITERKFHCNSQTSLIKGVKWLNNDSVNFISALAGAVFLVTLKEIIKV